MKGLEAALRELEAEEPEVAEARQRLDELPDEFRRYARHMAARAAVGERTAR